jgi:uncharacterized glyoxalase superfamily protein PhnB
MKRKLFTSVIRSSLLSILGLAVYAATASAQTGYADLVDHIHLGVPDQVKGVEWYHAHFGGDPMPEGPDRLMFGTTRLNFQKTDQPKPSQGTVYQTLGFSVANLDEATKKLQAEGVKIVMQPMTMEGMRMAQVIDPWGTLIDVVQDPKTLGLHHVYVQSSDPAAVLAWFASQFGGTVTKYGQVSGINYGGVWLLARRGASQPSTGSSFDHIGFRAVDTDASIVKFKTQNVKVTGEARDIVMANGAGVRIAFVESADGARVEIVQRR